MSKRQQIGVEWITDKYDDEVIRFYLRSLYDILASEMSMFGDETLNEVLNFKEDNKQEIKNNIIKTKLGLPSQMSAAGTIAVLSQSNAPFIIPPDLIEYIQDEIQSKEIFNRYTSTFPNNENLFIEGRNLFNTFIDSGYPTQAAYALVGALYTESGWNPNMFRKNATFMKNNDWTTIKEGLFGLSDWEKKKEIIKKLGLDKYAQVYGWRKNDVNKLNILDSKISLNKDYYNEGPFPSKLNKHQCACLFQLTEDYWGDITKEYLKMIPIVEGDDKTLYEYLMYNLEPVASSDNQDDDHKLLYASYMFKNGYDKKKDFDELKKIIPKDTSINDFIQQLLISYLLGQYVSGYMMEDLTLEEIFPDFGRLHMHSHSLKNDIIIVKKPEETISNIEITTNFKKGDGSFNIENACNWLQTNSAGQSQHVCAKYVRLALEAGGLDTSKRPDWAWKYINYLPTIGFELVGKINKSNTSGYTPEPGDIAVYMKGDNPNVPGHICMYTGRQWCSDFKQNSMIVYTSTPEAYVFRYKFDEEETA